MKITKFYFLMLMVLVISCNNSGEQKAKKKNETKIETTANDDLIQIEKNGRSFYDWYFKNEFPNSDIVKGENGKVLLDTTSYFKTLRSLGTISEKFISREKNRLQGCAEFMASLDYSDYENAEAYDYDEYCEEIYYSYWIKSQEYPINFSTKNLTKIDGNKGSLDIYVDYGGGGVPLSKVLLEKEQNIWKIVEIKFIDRPDDKPNKVNIYDRKWYGGIVALKIGEKSLAFKYHGQCVYYYPVKKISDAEFEMIWARDMDCKFDNGTDEKFGLEKVPEIGKPFAKYTLKNNILYAEYYYKDWVENYTEKVQDGVFEPKYFWRNE